MPTCSLYRAVWRTEELVAALRAARAAPVFLASSPRFADEEEVHLTVAGVEYEAFGMPHWGAASTFLLATKEEVAVPLFIEANDRFRLPADDRRDIIMIGPGTGVAPFRAFVQDRRETGARSRNWLLFGNRHFTRDFAEDHNGRWKFHPLADWTDRDVGLNLKRHDFPYHPLWEQGYTSIGDVHTSHRWEPGMDPEDARFFGLKRECGLHNIL